MSFENELKEVFGIDIWQLKPQFSQQKTNEVQASNNASETVETTIKLETKGLYNLSMLNSTGQIILKKSFFGTALKINLTDQPQGLYYISLINSEGIRSKNIKVIKTD